jgi:hypothetical protein
VTSLKHRDRSASQLGTIYWIYWSTSGNSTLSVRRPRRLSVERTRQLGRQPSVSDLQALVSDGAAAARFIEESRQQAALIDPNDILYSQEVTLIFKNILQTPGTVEVRDSSLRYSYETIHRCADFAIEVTEQSATGPRLKADSVLRFPITCPICGDETLFLASAAKITNALATGVPIWLIVECCGGVEWIASASEVDQITQYATIFRPGLD